MEAATLRSDRVIDLVSNHAPPFSPVTRANAYQVFWGSSFSSADVYLKDPTITSQGKRKGEEWKLKTPFFCALQQLGTIQPARKGVPWWQQLETSVF